MTVHLAPKVKGLFLLGNILDFLEDPFAYVDMVASHGDVVDNLGGQLIHYVFHPDDIEHVLLKNGNNYTKGTLIKRLRLLEMVLSPRRGGVENTTQTNGALVWTFLRVYIG